MSSINSLTTQQISIPRWDPKFFPDIWSQILTFIPEDESIDTSRQNWYKVSCVCRDFWKLTQKMDLFFLKQQNAKRSPYSFFEFSPSKHVLNHPCTFKNPVQIMHFNWQEPLVYHKPEWIQPEEYVPTCTPNKWFCNCQLNATPCVHLAGKPLLDDEKDYKIFKNENEPYGMVSIYKGPFPIHPIEDNHIDASGEEILKGVWGDPIRDGYILLKECKVIRLKLCENVGITSNFLVEETNQLICGFANGEIKIVDLNIIDGLEDEQVLKDETAKKAIRILGSHEDPVEKLLILDNELYSISSNSTLTEMTIKIWDYLNATQQNTTIKQIKLPYSRVPLFIRNREKEIVFSSSVYQSFVYEANQVLTGETIQKLKEMAVLFQSQETAKAFEIFDQLQLDHKHALEDEVVRLVKPSNKATDEQRAQAILNYIDFAALR